MDEPTPPPGVEDPDDAFKELVARASPLLKPHGFKKQGTKYYRDTGLTVQWLVFLRSQWRVGREWPISYYLRAKLEFRPLGSAPSTSRPKSSAAWQECEVSQWLDGWDGERGVWDIGNRNDAEAAWPVIQELIETAFIPFAEHATTIEGLKEIERRGIYFINWDTVNSSQPNDVGQ